MKQLLFCLFTFLLALVATPSAGALSWRIGAVDVPKDHRRMHKKSIPRGGGMAIFSAFIVAALAAGEGDHNLFCALGGGVLMLFVGLADDVVSLGAGVKFFFQLVISLATVLGLGIRGIWSIPAVLWVLSLCNAHNFIDGLDGLFAGCAGIEGVALAGTFLLGGENISAVPPLLLAAACLGFRVFNRHPARIFAGDSGSCTVGFLLGVFSLPLFAGDGVQITTLSPLLLFAYPLTDLSAAVLRRVLRGKSPFSADRGHLHHRICDAGLSHRQCVGVLLLISGGLSSAGLLIHTAPLAPYAAIVCLLCAGLLVTLRNFIVKVSRGY